MSKEVHLQFDMFTDELVDTRTRKQKKKAKEQEHLKQAEMFSQPEIALQDMWTEKEKERAFQKEVDERSYQLPGILDKPD